MPFGGPGAKTGLDPRQEFGRQRDFRQQDQRLPPVAQTFGHSLQIDLGLAGPGDPLQQGGAVIALCDGGRQGGGGGDLFAHQLHLGGRGVQIGIGQVAGGVFFGDDTGLHQTLDHG